MPNAIFALTLANTLDILRRGGTLVLGAAGIVLILSLRWFSAFGLGYEVVQLKELGVYTIGLLGAVAVLVFSLPSEDDAEEADALLLTRPVPVWVLSLGSFLGRLIPLVLLCCVWSLAIFTALLWFEIEDPRLFHYRGSTSAFAESGSLFLPVLGQLFATGILLGFVQPIARLRRPVLVGLATLGLYVLGYSVGGLGGVWSVILPDLARHDLTPLLWGTAGQVSVLGLAVHACAWCAAGVALDSIGLTVKSVA
ncbi:MAG: hypothetical protein KDB68_11435 [Planctomycetes bacterium]|nr:hypothetical protein [Planctomycetota bacterium]